MTILTATYSSEHRRLAPVLEMARQYDIDSNPAPEAVYEPGSGGLCIWCTPEDNPGGVWQAVSMDAGAFTKPCEWLASVIWGWTETPLGPVIDYLDLSTEAYALQRPERLPRSHNRRLNHPDDVMWAKKKITWLFEKAGVPCPEIRVDGLVI